MSKQKNKNLKKRSILFRTVVSLVLLAFIVLMLSDLFTKKSELKQNYTNLKKSENFKFKKHGELSFKNVNGDFISSVDIEIADNDFERAQGLMYRESMLENQTMLFVFPREEMQSFYMKNTIISLDIIFVNSDLEIVTIHKETKPYSLSSLASTSPAQYVVETVSGYTDKFNINIGDKVIFRKTN